MGGGGMMGGTGFGGLGGFGGFGLLGGILNLVITLGIIIGIALFVIWLVRRSSSIGGTGGAVSSSSPEASPREIVQGRYARGEITREQYRQFLADLS